MLVWMTVLIHLPVQYLLSVVATCWAFDKCFCFYYLEIVCLLILFFAPRECWNTPIWCKTVWIEIRTKQRTSLSINWRFHQNHNFFFFLDPHKSIYSSLVVMSTYSQLFFVQPYKKKDSKIEKKIILLYWKDKILLILLTFN